MEGLVLAPTPPSPKSKTLFASSIRLLGHEAELMACQFSPCGDYAASAGQDRTIFLWDVFDPKCKNFGVLRGHGHTILDLAWDIDTSILYSASADHTARVWDISTGQKLRKLKQHHDVVNAVDIMPHSSELLATVSDDGSCLIWDLRQREIVADIQVQFPLTCVTFGKTTQGGYVFFAGLDNIIKAFNLRKGAIEYEMEGHHDTPTGLALSRSGNFLLSNSMDMTLKAWDIRPFVGEDRCVQTYVGGKHNYEKSLLKCAWGPNDEIITGGSSDGMVYLWDTRTGKILDRLGGHSAAVTDVAFHPSMRILLSASTDRTLYLGTFDQ